MIIKQYSNILSSIIHSSYSKSYNLIQNEFNEVIKVPQKWIEDIKHIEFNELLASSIGPLALYFGWKKRHKEEFSEIASECFHRALFMEIPLEQFHLL